MKTKVKKDKKLWEGPTLPAKRAAFEAMIPKAVHDAVRLLAPDNPDLAIKALAVAKGLEKFKIAPMRDRIFVLKADPRQQIGGIVIPDIAQESVGVGVVVGVGSGHYEHGVITPLEVQVGQVVTFSKYGGMPQKIGDSGLEVFQFREEEIQSRAG